MKYPELHKEAESVLNRLRFTRFEFDYDNADKYTVEELRKLLSDIALIMDSCEDFESKLNAIIDSGESPNNLEESTLETIENINFYFSRILLLAQTLEKLLQAKLDSMDEILSSQHKV